MKRLWGIIACLVLAACGREAPRNPLQSSVAPVPAAYDCPSRFNFESPASLGPWQAPSWAGGFSPLSLDSAHTVCGTGALKTKFQMNGTNTAVLFCLLPQGENVTGDRVVANFYFAVPPPADLGMQIFFIDRYDNWLDPPGASHYGLTQGWNQISEDFNIPGVTDVVGILVQFTTNNGVAYAGDLWVDEINW
jgi:hypothetical protein